MRWIDAFVLAFLIIAIAVAVEAQPPDACSGDCDGDAVVTIDEIVRLVAAVLGGDASACASGDDNGDGAITVDEVIVAVTHALYGCIFGPPRSEAIRLFPGVKLEVGERPVSLAVADLDGDGRPDLCTANAGSNDLSLLFRTENGGFKRRARAAAGGGPQFVLPTRLGTAGAAALAANRVSGELSVTVVRNTAVVTERYAAGQSPVALTAADLDGDSVNDVIVANRDSGDLSVLLGEPDGAFAPGHTFAATDGVASVAAGDIDGNLISDVVAANGSRRIAILSGLGDGGLAAPTFLDVASSARFVVIGDVNADRANDLVLAGTHDQGHAAIDILLGHGDGRFLAADQILVEAPPAGIVVADIDDDGVADVVSAGGTSVSVFFGRGDGSFLSESALPSGCSLSAVAVVDVDLDEAKDIVLACELSDEVAVLWGRGGRTFAAEQVLPVGGMLPQRVLAGDVDGDGATDLATVNGLSDDISVLRAVGKGRFAAPVTVATQPGLLGAALGDLDGDAAAELVSGHESSACRDCLVVFGRDAEGRFDRRGQLSVSPRVVGLAITDLDKDNLGDIVSLGGEGASIFIGLGDFEFGPERTFAAGRDPRAMAIVDLNGDAVDDVAIANAGSIDVSVLLSTGGGAFAPALTLPLTTEPAEIAAGDVNVDGHIDLVVQGGERLSLFLGQGAGAFSSEQRVGMPVRGSAFNLADVDADGLPDLVAIADGSAVYLGTGMGSFRPPLRFAGNPLAADLVVVDADVDGRLDIVTANSTVQGSLSIILGFGP